MKSWFRLTGFNLLLLCTFSSVAASYADFQDEQRQTKEQTRALVKYLLNLGSYLGYDLKKEPPPASQTSFSRNLVDASNTQLLENLLLTTTLGAIPVNAISKEFLPPRLNLADATLINNFANATFEKPPYNTPTQQQGTIAVKPLIDQKTYQKDPISQAILNILGTPNDAVCANLKNDPNQPLCQNKVMSAIIGELPNPEEFYLYRYNEKFLGQLNINSLLAPLMYTTENTSGTSSSGGNETPEMGLTAQSQAQQAANFIRYASGAVVPATLPSQDTYEKLWRTTYETIQKTPTPKAIKAQNTLNTYLASLRVYAAQSSVGISNLYYILSKRIPQNQGEGVDSKLISSQAFSEYRMASWRLKPSNSPDPKVDNSWVGKINNASAASVQKEIAILLAEINYQMYLNRQQEERMLLTQSMMLIQNTKAAQPTFPAQGSGPTPP